MCDGLNFFILPNAHNQQIYRPPSANNNCILKKSLTKKKVKLNFYYICDYQFGKIKHDSGCTPKITVRKNTFPVINTMDTASFIHLNYLIPIQTLITIKETLTRLRLNVKGYLNACQSRPLSKVELTATGKFKLSNSAIRGCSLKGTL